MKWESCRKLNTEVVPVLNNNGKYINNPKVSASALDGHFLSPCAVHTLLTGHNMQP